MTENGDVQVRRDGDTWFFAWPKHQVGFGMDHLKDSSDGIHAELTVESVAPGANGRLAGPVRLNVLSARSQSEMATKLDKRLQGAIGKVDWDTLVTYACAVVAKQYRAPEPIFDLSEVQTSTRVEYLIPGLIPTDETTVVYGDGESAKSLFALRIAMSVTTGIQLPWLDHPTRTCKVLYLDWETNPRTVAGRLQRIAEGTYVTPPKILYRQCFRSIQDELPNIREEISKRDVGLVIVDSIGFAASGALIEDETARSAMNALRQLHPATRLVVAHISAEAARSTSGTARPFGSAFFWNGMRSGLELRRAEETHDPDAIELGLYHRKANDGEHHTPIGMTVMFDGRGGAVRFEPSEISDVPDLAARTPLSSRLRALLRKGATDARELAEDTDSTTDTVLRTLKRMPDVERVADRGVGRGAAVLWGLSNG